MRRMLSDDAWWYYCYGWLGAVVVLTADSFVSDTYSLGTACSRATADVENYLFW